MLTILEHRTEGQQDGKKTLKTQTLCIMPLIKHECVNRPSTIVHL